MLSAAGPRLRSGARKAKGFAEGQAGHPAAALKGAGAERGGAERGGAGRGITAVGADQHSLSERRAPAQGHRGMVVRLRVRLC